MPKKRSDETGKSSKKVGKELRSNRAGKRSQVDLGLVKALTHELRVEILAILGEQTASPKELSDGLGEGLSQVSYHVKVLREYACIELVNTEPRRGAVEHYYRATSRGRAALALMGIEVKASKQPRKSSSKSTDKGKK